MTLGCCPFKDAYVAHMTQKPKLGDTMQLALSQIVVPTFTFTSFMVCVFQLCAPVDISQTPSPPPSATPPFQKMQILANIARVVKK